MKYNIEKINKLLAEKVMQFCKRTDICGMDNNSSTVLYEYFSDEMCIKDYLWNPTQNIEQAKQIQSKIMEKVEKMSICFDNIKIIITCKKWDEVYNYIIMAETEELAICLLALKLWQIDEKEYMEE